MKITKRQLLRIIKEERLKLNKRRNLNEDSRRRNLKRQIRRIIREEQGYDDREDERLGMEHGALDTHDFDGDHEEEEHSRRDDAEFEDRNEAPEVHIHIHDSYRRDLKNKIRRIVRENTRSKK